MTIMEGGKEKSEERPNLYLSGFMGTGKTTIGRRIAEVLNYRFIDSDDEIEKAEGMCVNDIFEKFGEEKFRELERDFIENGHPHYGCVISCGGGLVCRDSMPELLRKKGVSVVLFSKPEDILERVSKSNKRPLLNVPNPLEKIKTLLSQRSPYYMKSGVAIVADANINFTVEHILRIYKKAVADIRRKIEKSASK